MGMTSERIRRAWRVRETPEGLELNLRVKLYRSGMVEVDGVPKNQGGKRPYDQAKGMAQAIDSAHHIIEEFDHYGRQWRQGKDAQPADR